VYVSIAYIKDFLLFYSLYLDITYYVASYISLSYDERMHRSPTLFPDSVLSGSQWYSG